jgi:hypothetical protein
MRRSLLSSLVVFAVVLVSPLAALADQFVDRLNALYKTIPDARRTDETLFPVLAKMADPPPGLTDLIQSALVPATAPEFAKFAEWAQGEPQKAVIEAIKKCTAEEGRGKTWEIGQPYGAIDANPDMVMVGMYTELGDPPLLAQAEIKWLPRMQAALTLVQIEATRLQAEGKPAEAMDLVLRGVFLGRQLAGRGLFAEMNLGFEAMVVGLARLRDLAYQDMRADQPKLTPEQIRDLIARMRDRNGVLQIDRIELPLGDRLAAEQLISRIMKADGSVEPDAFARTLSRIAARQRAMRLFSEDAKWSAIAKLHADGKASINAIEQVFGDWAKRWRLNLWDPVLKLPTDFSRLSRTKFAAVEVFLADVGVLFSRRTELQVELVGTRSALGHYGYFLQMRRFAPDSASIKPAFVPGNELDPFDPTLSQWMTLMVPGRGTASPIRAAVFPRLLSVSYTQFEVSFGPETFVMYSMGPKASRAGGKRFTQMTFDNQGDYLIWPPMLSLIRQNQSDLGRWK